MNIGDRQNATRRVVECQPHRPGDPRGEAQDLCFQPRFSGSCRCGAGGEPDHSLHIVDEVGEADLGFGSGNADGGQMPSPPSEIRLAFTPFHAHTGCRDKADDRVRCILEDLVEHVVAQIRSNTG